MAQADYVISVLESSVELFVEIKLTEKDVTFAKLCYAVGCCRMSLEHTTEKKIRWLIKLVDFVQKNKKRDTLVRVLFESGHILVRPMS